MGGSLLCERTWRELSLSDTYKRIFNQSLNRADDESIWVAGLQLVVTLYSRTPNRQLISPLLIRPLPSVLAIASRTRRNKNAMASAKMSPRKMQIKATMSYKFTPGRVTIIIKCIQVLARMWGSQKPLTLQEGMQNHSRVGTQATW